jgi:hypothetical protein
MGKTASNMIDSDGYVEEELLDELLQMITSDPGALVPAALVSDLLRDAEATRTKRARTTRNRTKDLWSTSWGVQLTQLEEDPENETSYEARVFRRRFRLPYSQFKKLVEECREHNVFEQLAEGKIPIEFKVLASLRILGRDACCDDIEEALNIGGSTVNKCFKLFVRGCDAKLFDKHVKLPEGEELRHVKEQYQRLGLPGCVGSMDVTHIQWHRCPYKMQNGATGKERHPTLAFQCVVSHSRKIHHCSRAFFGRLNDKQITVLDSYPNEIWYGTAHPQETFTLFNEEGEVTLWQGAYLIVDGGYQKVTGFIDPKHASFTYEDVVWSEWIESVRKDVECCFGILKMRWRFLRNPIVYQDAATLASAFRTACMLHNILLEHDQLDKFDWEYINPNDDEMREPTDAEVGAEVDAEVEVERTEEQRREQQRRELRHAEWGEEIRTRLQLDAEQANSTQVPLPRPGPGRTQPLPWSDRNYHRLRDSLVSHFAWVHMNGQLQWPKRFTRGQRATLPRRRLRPGAGTGGFMALQRAGRTNEINLFVVASKLRALDEHGLYTRHIGFGLFSRTVLQARARIVEFVGEVIGNAERLLRVAAGNGKYMVQLRGMSRTEGPLWMDCHNTCMANMCKGSRANSPRGVRFEGGAAVPTANASLHVALIGVTWTAWLEAEKKIAPNVEILRSYKP